MSQESFDISGNKTGAIGFNNQQYFFEFLSYLHNNSIPYTEETLNELFMDWLVQKKIKDSFYNEEK